MYLEILSNNSKKKVPIKHFIGEEVVLFGAATYGQKIVDELEAIGANILFFCDNNPKLCGNKVKNFDETSQKEYTIFCPEEIYRHPRVKIIITSTYFDEISLQLKEMGIKEFYLAKMGVHRAKIELSEFQNECLDFKIANEIIAESINSNSSFFIGRLGSVELEAICHYKYFEKRYKNTDLPYQKNVVTSLIMNAGFFPNEDKLVDQFVELYISGLSKIDLIWSMWHSRFEDMLYTEYCREVSITDYEASNFPIELENSWIKSLKGKKVLVIHPFEESIRINYQNKEKLFSKKDAIPDFELITLKAVQSIAGTKTGFNTWFDALMYMQQKIETIDFDVALIGAGGYGFPLGAYIKSIGKKAIHVGGALQLFFGIKGKFFDSLNIYNEYWTYPLESERPESYKKVESGRYW